MNLGLQNSNNNLKRKILNDPIYGFITIESNLIFDLVQHPYFQRLRRISQLGLTNLVYPGANHSRFQHALGAMHLMHQAIEVLRSKGHEITTGEAIGAQIAILLHDIGHGPFSHTLEKTIVEGVNHEVISAILMDNLNHFFNGKLDVALAIFKNQYPKKFLHQLVSSQLDMDRLDYLRRDSFFTGVSEGVVSSDRIIKMLEVKNDMLCVESKGIYSIEKFLVARRLMYWQVYLHKTVLSAEFLLTKIFQRAKELSRSGVAVESSKNLNLFIAKSFSEIDFRNNPQIIDAFTKLDDTDVLSAVKLWTTHPDFILSRLSQNLIERRLYKVKLQNNPFNEDVIEKISTSVTTKLNLNPELLPYFVFKNSISNSAYTEGTDTINILYKDGTLLDITQAADLLNISVMAKPVIKHYLCYPKWADE